MCPKQKLLIEIYSMKLKRKKYGKELKDPTIRISEFSSKKGTCQTNDCLLRKQPKKAKDVFLCLCVCYLVINLEIESF